MLWVKSFHIIFVICWFAGLFYLPRLFVWHAMTEDTAGRERFKLMERKLYRGIMTPCMVLTLLFGGWLLWLLPAYLADRLDVREAASSSRCCSDTTSCAAIT